MNIDELSLKVAEEQRLRLDHACGCSSCRERDDPPKIKAFARALIAEYEKSSGSEPVAYRTWRETKMYGVWEYRTDELELNDDDWEPLYTKPDPRVAELEAQLKTALGVIDKIDDTYEEQNAALLVAIEAKDTAIGGMFGPTHILRDDRFDLLSKAWSVQPSAELLESRDRKRDAKLLRGLAKLFNHTGLASQFTNLALKRESGEWVPELGD